MDSYDSRTIWDMVLSILVCFHLATEYVHYFLEWYSGRREKNILEDIQTHRKKSKKTELLETIQTDLALIKERLQIGEDNGT